MALEVHPIDPAPARAVGRPAPPAAEPRPAGLREGAPAPRETGALVGGEVPAGRDAPPAARDAPAGTDVDSPTDIDAETDWMVRFSRGDDTAFEEIVKTYQPRICRFLRGRILDADRAEDLTQEVFLRVHRARHRYRPTARLRTWLYTIANRLALNEIRAVRRRRRVFPTLFPSRRKGNPEADPTAGPLSLDDLPAATRSRGTASASARAQANELEETIGELLERLPVNQRTAIELFASERLTYAEIAGAMGVTVASVRSLIVRARGSLRVGLGPYLGEEPGPTGEAPRTMGEAPRTMGEAPRRTGEAPRTVGEEPGREEVEP